MNTSRGWEPYHPEFEYPDEAGYPDGVGTLHEGQDEQGSEVPSPFGE
jgi:hypothetical protein